MVAGRRTWAFHDECEPVTGDESYRGVAELHHIAVPVEPSHVSDHAPPGLERRVRRGTTHAQLDRLHRAAWQAAPEMRGGRQELAEKARQPREQAGEPVDVAGPPARLGETSFTRLTGGQSAPAQRRHRGGQIPRNKRHGLDTEATAGTRAPICQGGPT